MPKFGKCNPHNSGAWPRGEISRSATSVCMLKNSFQKLLPLAPPTVKKSYNMLWVLNLGCHIHIWVVLLLPIYWLSWKAASFEWAKNKSLQRVHLARKLLCHLEHMTQQIQFALSVYADSNLVWNILWAGIKESQNRALEFWTQTMTVSTYNFPDEKSLLFATVP